MRERDGDDFMYCRSHVSVGLVTAMGVSEMTIVVLRLTISDRSM